MKEQARNQKKVIDLIEKSTRDPGPVLDKLQKLLPQGTTVKSFSLQADNSVALSVTIPTPVDVARLWTSLRDSGMFLNVDMQTLSLQDKAQDFSFALKFK
jgi:type IV pilus assembly protein PilN